MQMTMTAQPASHATPSGRLTISTAGDSSLKRLEQAIEHAAHLLPSQGPITVFIHHNTLHALEHLHFEDAVEEGARIFGCQPYLAESQYRRHLERGRIRQSDLSAILLEDLGDDADVLIGPFGTRFHLRLAMLQYPLRQAPDAELRWFVAETDALSKFRDDVPAAARQNMIHQTRHWVMRDLRRSTGPTSGEEPAIADRNMQAVLATLFEHFGEKSIDRWSEATWESFTLHALWRICREGVHAIKPTHAQPAQPPRHRDVLLAATGEDTDRLVNELLVRFCAAYLDQGFASWTLPKREQGFLGAFRHLYRQPGGLLEGWLNGLPARLKALDGQDAISIVHAALVELGVAESQWDAFLASTMLSLRGWAGMIHQIQERADRAAQPIAGGSLIEYLAVRLVLECLALGSVAREHLGFTGPLQKLRHVARSGLVRHETASVDQRAFLVFQLAQVRGWLPSNLRHLTRPQWSVLMAELEAFSQLQRRRAFHLAFERRYRIQTLDAYAISAQQRSQQPARPAFQVACCLDEREESFRRHLEEVAPEVETFGVAGFYAVAMYYRGAADAHFAPLCPVVVRPQHWVEETVVETLEHVHRRRSKTRRALGTASHQISLGSRSFAGGAMVAAALGPFATVPLVARVLLPRLTAQIRRWAGRLVQPPPATQLKLERTHPQPGIAAEQLGFNVEEMTNIAEGLLREMGMARRFARLVILLGHGSSSLNNPHNSAYNCGACGGRAGGPNARAAAHVLNDPRVRANLAERGIRVPEDTWFVGGYHNTCNDEVTYHDVDRLPPTHRQELESARQKIEESCDRNAHERCRRFRSAPLEMSFTAARRHVEERSEDLAQTRPECGHASNAICYVGRRSRTLGLFLDRRTFLTSYDPEEDDANHNVLERVLRAAVPVCAGINLEYYFSYVDPVGYGASTKLPHNVASLLGVMDGAASDLRTGLPWQMVEIHDPVRLLFIIETTPEAVLSIIKRNPGIDQLIRNDWCQLAVLDPGSAKIQLFRQDRFEPYEPEETTLPTVAASVDWYRGWREHLGYALIDPNSRPASALEGERAAHA
jgi:uncharacterized protein YbcC (UPF0753/DUF2309 family)